MPKHKYVDLGDLPLPLRKRLAMRYNKTDRNAAVLMQHGVRPTIQNREAATELGRIPYRYLWTLRPKFSKNPEHALHERLRLRRRADLQSLCGNRGVDYHDHFGDEVVFDGSAPDDFVAGAPPRKANRDFRLLNKALPLDNRVVLAATLDHVSDDDVEVYRVAVAFRKKISHGYVGAFYSSIKKVHVAAYAATSKAALEAARKVFRTHVADTLRCA